MVLWHLPLRDGKVTTKPRFRREQVVKTKVAPAFGDVETDGEQVARLVEEKTKIHSRQFVTLTGECFQSAHPVARTFGRLAQNFRSGRELAVELIEGGNFLQGGSRVTLRNFAGEISVLQPRRMEIQFVQMLDATALQRLRPSLQISVSQRHVRKLESSWYPHDHLQKLSLKSQRFDW